MLRTAFSDDEWMTVVLAPAMAAFAVTAADPGGLIGAAQEAGATGRAISDAARAEESGLTGEVARAYQDGDTRARLRDEIRAIVKGRKPREATEMAVERVGAASRLVAERTPGEAMRFDTWLREIAEDVAEAAKEGGFLGFGGERVSEAERQTLDRIDAVLQQGPDTPLGGGGSVPV